MMEVKLKSFQDHWMLKVDLQINNKKLSLSKGMNNNQQLRNNI
jgi:hypothetical protein